ncbi:MAG: response regulator [Candidatus Zixiibacteriota bacterium]
MTTDRVLFVDDEENLLNAIRRQFRREFDMTTAQSGKEALALIESDGPFAVVVSDLRMPEMDGIQFLTAVREKAPDTVRMMLTGNADVSAAMQAVNEGNIFRFMAKPCPTETLRSAVRAGIDQYHLLRTEREMLESTLQGSIRLMSDLLATISPLASGRATRVKRYVRQLVRLISEKIPIDESILWQFETAAMLSQIGALLLPQPLLKKVLEGKKLEPNEQALFDKHPSVGRKLIVNIPRLEPIGEIIALQNVRFDEANTGTGTPTGYDLPLPARVLKVALDFDEQLTRGNTQTESLAILQSRESWYDPDILAALARLVKLESSFKVARLYVKDVTATMILAENVLTSDGQLLIAKGFELTDSMIQRLQHYSANSQLKEPICVIMPTSLQAAVAKETPAPVLS